MSKRSQLLESISETIADYRKGENVSPTPQHVERWVRQFDKSVEVPLLAEMDHVLNRSYISKRTAKRFIANLVTNDTLAGDSPCRFWRQIKFLDIQSSGNSQRDMLALFDGVLERKCGMEVAKCGANAKAFLYLDDGLFSGNRVRNDLCDWIRDDAPAKAQLHVVVMALHISGWWYAKKAVEATANTEEKEIKITWWRCVEMEDRKNQIDKSDVLRTTHLPKDKLTGEYVSYLNDCGYPPLLRQADKMGNSKVFSSEEGRDVLEQQFLQSGLRIREMCPNLKLNHRPLGYSVLKTLGFGSLIVTYRNCPNTCPLAFWAGDPWYPLFPRKTN